MGMTNDTSNDFCTKWICDPKGYSIIITVSVINFLVFIYNCYKGCKDSTPSKPSNSHASEERNIRNMQIYISQQYASSTRDTPSSVVLPASGLDISFSQSGPPTEYVRPDQVDCTTIFHHRKLFLGRIEWCGYEGFLKECVNPLEMTLHRKLQHKNIVQFYFVNIADKPKIIVQNGLELKKALPISFYCMEYCPRGNLSSFLVERGHFIDTEQLFGLISDVVRGVQYLHSLKVAHRDIKSENILIKGHIGGPVRPVAKIADFDHAIQTWNEFEMGTQGSKRRHFGSPLYTAPEFILETIAQPVAVDFFRHDVYSLGLVIWECLTWIKCRRRQEAQATALNQDSLTDPLLPHQTRSVTTDIGDIRSVVTCSSTVHLPLIKQICDSLNLKYNRQEKALRVNNLFYKEGRLIDTRLMFEFYSKVPEARPVLFRDTADRYTGQVNHVMEYCWKSKPSERLCVDDIMKKIDDICVSISGGQP
ncbi:hypothetical protein ACHWQZ_G013811 [Mnemiopsis leidyi]